MFNSTHKHILTHIHTPFHTTSPSRGFVACFTNPAPHHTTPHQFIRNQKFGTPSPVLVVSSGQQPDHLLFVFRSVQYNFYFFESIFRLIPSSPFRSSRVLPSVRTAAVQFSSVPGGSAYPFKVFL